MTNALPKSLTLPLDESALRSLKTGDVVRLSGTLYTARDAAHARLAELLNRGAELPVPLTEFAVYYCGPTPTREGEVIGSCGPTTSARMDDYTPLLISRGVRIMVGKGKRSDAVNDAIKQYGAVYFAAIGGAGALYKSCVKQMECVAFPDLGCEAIYRLQVQDMALIVATDTNGDSFLF